MFNTTTPMFTDRPSRLVAIGPWIDGSQSIPCHGAAACRLDGAIAGRVEIGWARGSETNDRVRRGIEGKCPMRTKKLACREARGSWQRATRQMLRLCNEEGHCTRGYVSG